MTSFMKDTARHFVLIKAAREIGKEIEKAGLDNLQNLADAGVSIVGTYLYGCSSQEKIRIRRELNTLLQMKVTPEMIFSELTRQIPQLSPIMGKRENYKQGELQKLKQFLQDG